MKLICALWRQKKKKSKYKGLLKAETTSTDSEGCGSSSFDENVEDKSSSHIIGPDGVLIPRFSKSIDGSALALFAGVSTAYAELAEEESVLTSHTSDLYRPGSLHQESKIVHPVVCKRDIYMEDVKKKKGRKKSIYDCNHRPKQNREPDRTKQYRGKNNLSSFVSTSTSRPEHKEIDALESERYYDAAAAESAPMYSVSASMLFRQSNQLKIETGRIRTDDALMMRANPRRLHNASPEQHNGKVAQDWGRPPRFTNCFVSPSSTVSSLTHDCETPKTPATPARMSYTPHGARCASQLEDIQELGDIQEFGGIITTGNYENIDESYTEI